GLAAASEATQSRAPAVEPGSTLGRYRIVAPLGAGGMGEVYRARDTRLDRDVAIKVLPARVAGEPTAVGAFERGAPAGAELAHPNIVPLYDVGTEGDVVYVVTELLTGRTVRRLLETGPLAVERAVELSLQVATGLAAAHEKGIVHRDLKPE